LALYVLTYDVRMKNHDYARLYELLRSWGAAHLQDSVWLADLNGGASAIRDAMKTHMHADDTACVIQIPSISNWATSHARQEGTDWLKAH
jgi:CRISPR/Cas system-associated endoribonuclease Cas2